MKQKADNVVFTLVMNERQAKIVNAAVEEYMRIRLFQFEDLSDVIAAGDYVYNKDDPENSQKFDRYIDIRNRLRSTLDSYKREIFFPNGYPTTRNEEADIAGDIWSTLRHELYKLSGRTDLSSIDSHEPIRIGSEPLPECHLNYGDLRKDTHYRYMKWCIRCSEREHCKAKCVKLNKLPLKMSYPENPTRKVENDDSVR